MFLCQLTFILLAFGKLHSEKDMWIDLFLQGLQGFVAIGQDIQQSSIGHEVKSRKGFLLLLQIVIPDDTKC